MTAGEKLTVVIAAKNEEAVIARAIRSVSWADEVLVLDSGSTDGTRDIARELGATVHEQAWLGWAPQRDRGAELARNDWVFFVDADEIVTPELAASAQSALAAGADPRGGFSMSRREEFAGEFMPDMRRAKRRKAFVRIYNRRFGAWDPAMLVHEEVRCPGRIRPLEGDLLHWRNYTIGRQFDTLNRNANLEAQELVRDGRFRKSNLFVKPLLRFLWLFFWKRHFRKGTKGFVWAGLHANAEFLRLAKAWEQLHTSPTPHPPGYASDPDEPQASLRRK